uniref:type I protein arginine methyltransferase n=1 Tax=Corethron hystrix TaxID=216773 RepID=A0A6U5M0R9_9STRA
MNSESTSSAPAALIPSSVTSNGSAVTASSNVEYRNASATGEIPSYDGDDRARATDFANYFCSYAQLYHQKQMLTDHKRMEAYYDAIMGNADVFRDKVVMDVGTGSGILAVWAAHAGARRVYAVEYTDMANHARRLVEENGVGHVVTVIQGAVEDIDPQSLEGGKEAMECNDGCIDIIISEWMGYFLLRESMLDSLIRARDKFLKKNTGLMFPSHTTMYFAPVMDEEERKTSVKEYTSSMTDWNDFVESTKTMYGVDMGALDSAFQREQKEYYLLSSRWCELRMEQVLAEPCMVKYLDMCTCTLEESRGILRGAPGSSFDFDVVGEDDDTASSSLNPMPARHAVVSGFSGWFTADFKSRTDADGSMAPKISHPTLLSTGPENGYTHWGQQVFHLLSNIPVIRGQTTRIKGELELARNKDNARLYNCRVRFSTTRRRTGEPKAAGTVLMNGPVIETVYQIP